MGETPPHFLYGSRFVRLLSNMIRSDTGSDTEIAGDDFVRQFAQLLHFSGAANLAKALNTPVKKGGGAGSPSEETLRETVLSRQNELVRFIANSFVTASPGREDRLPGPESLHHHLRFTGAFAADAKKQSNFYPTVYEPYRKFYISRQRLMEARIQRLRADVREKIAGMAPELAGLARIDKALADSLSTAPRDILTTVPDLLAKRFYRLIDEHWHELSDNPEPDDLKPWIAPGGWINIFCREMLNLLFAELDFRLQPVFGMIDALPPQAAAHPDQESDRCNGGGRIQGPCQSGAQ